MNIRGFKIKNHKIQKIWIAVTLALSVATILIVIAFFLVFKKSSNSNFNEEDLFNYSSYYAKYNALIYSNKNQNSYNIEEFCLKNTNETKFRFNTLNDGNNYSYIITNNSFQIRADNQINKFEGVNSINNVNILSLATFIEIYNKVDKMLKENLINENCGIKLKIDQKDKEISYNITFDNKANIENELSIYKDTIINGMKISKMQLIFDINTKKPIEYIIFLEDGNAYSDIIYTDFKINTKFDEKVFSF